MANTEVEIGRTGKARDRTLFVDDRDIASSEGVERVIHPGKKHGGNPVLTPDQPWVDSLHIGGTVRLENGLYRSWYHGTGQSGNFNLYADSEDGVHWTTPVLGQYEDDTGSLENNIYLSRVGLRSGDPAPPSVNQDVHPSILYTPHMGEGRTYTLLSYDYGRSGYGAYDGYFLAFSEDGICWTDGPEDPVIPGHADVGYFLYDERDGVFRAVVKDFLNIRGWRRRSVFWTESYDAFDWSMPRAAIIPDLVDEEWAEGRDGHFTQFYGMPIVRYESMVLAFLQVFRCTDGENSIEGTIDIQLVSSRDGRHWQRVGDRRAIIERGEEGDWDWGIVRTGNSFVLDGDEIRAYYNGSNHSHAGRTPSGEPKTGAIGYVTWPRDRFVGIEAGRGGGEVRLTAQQACGQLHVNADAAGGFLAVELAADGGQVPGFGAATCVPMTTDSLDHVVQWDGERCPTQLGGRPVDVVVRLTDAELFSLWWD